MNIFLINEIFYARQASGKTQLRYFQYGKLQGNIGIKNILCAENCSQNLSTGERDSSQLLFRCDIAVFC